MQTGRQVTIAGAVLVAALANTTARAQAVPPRVEQAARERMAAGEYPALVIAVVDGGTSTILVLGTTGEGPPAGPDTVFEIGSVTKTFTATLLAQAVADGVVTLDEPLARLLPDFTIPDRDGKSITLGDLATQHSGLPRLPTNFAPAAADNPYADYDAAKLKAFFAGYRLPRDPGASYEYSNLGVGVLGYALGRAYRSDYPALLTSKIFGPLGMGMSGTALSPAMRATLAPGHDAAGRPVRNWDMDVLAGAGAIRSTGADMLRYLKANMGIEPTPLGTAMTLAQQARETALPNDRIGFVWMTRTTPSDTTTVIWHNGMTAGYASFVGFTADRRRGVVVLTNIARSVDDLGFAALLPDAPLAPARKAITLPAAALDAYVGSYRLAENFLLTITRNGDDLLAQATGQAAFPIYPTAANEFFATVAGIAISFQRDAAGAITGLVLHQNGDRPARKLSAAEVPAPPKPVRLAAAVLADYVGRYDLSGVAYDVTLKDGQLFAQLAGQPSAPIYASARDRFFYTAVAATIDFTRDARGRVTGLTLHQNGADIAASRSAASHR